MRTLTRTEVGSSHLRAFAVGTDRVALVPEQAVLLAGDVVVVEVRVAAGQRLEVVEPGGTVAYAMRGDRARWDVRIEVAEGGSLVWEAQPFVVAEGAHVLRTTTVDLAGDATVALRETLVLGRAHEGPGRLVARTEVSRDQHPLLVEELDSRVGLGGHRVVDQLLHLGGGCAGDAMVLEGGGHLHRWLGDQVHLSPVAMQ